MFWENIIVIGRWMFDNNIYGYGALVGIMQILQNLSFFGFAGGLFDTRREQFWPELD